MESNILWRKHSALNKQTQKGVEEYLVLLHFALLHLCFSQVKVYAALH